MVSVSSLGTLAPMGSGRFATFVLVLVSTALALGVAELVLRNVRVFATDAPRWLYATSIHSPSRSAW